MFASECPDDRRPLSQRLAELPESYSVFAGRAIQVKSVEKWIYETEFAVTKSWRGVQSSRITVRSNVYVLGPEFEAGKDYLVFAAGNTGASWLRADGCTTTSQLSEAGPWLKVLGKPRYVPGVSNKSAPR